MTASPFTVGDKGTVLTGVCTDGGTPVDLTGQTIELHIRTSAAELLTRTATLATAPGTWTYQWGTNELTTAGSWTVEAQVTSADGSIIQTFGPVQFTVRPQLG